MDTSRTAKRILEWKPMGSRPLGRPRLRWLDDVCDDLKVLEVRNWKELAMDRKTCLGKLKPTNGCSANGRRRRRSTTKQCALVITAMNILRIS
jgi:hypothetical protein